MSVEKAFRELIRHEVEAQLRPLQNAISRLQEGAAELNTLRNIAERLAPLGSIFGGGRRGRPARVGRKGRRENASNDRPCALIGCKSKARSKGYCAAHYQKYRLLAKSDRLPAAWVEYAPPSSVENVVLPRGRAAAKAKAASKKG